MELIDFYILVLNFFLQLMNQILVLPILRLRLSSSGRRWVLRLIFEFFKLTVQFHYFLTQFTIFGFFIRVFPTQVLIFLNNEIICQL